MASAKKKQDEKNLKSLRELVSLPGNKECFDCNQRGPTYANMTIGSFVCTTCSGMLRGLTPPHRVKSISMATFTQEEIDFLKERGNDYCRPIWLGLMPQNAQPQSNKDEQKMKDFMSAKYELKRFYLDPNMANQLTNNHKLSRQNAVKYKVQGNDKNFNTLKSPPSKSSLLSLPNSFASNNSNTINQKSKDAVELINSNNVDFIADFSKVPEPCPLSIPISKFNNIQPIVPQPSFANFDNNPIFDSSKSLSNVNQTNPSNFLNNTNGVINSPPPSEDRYAALKDLDCMMKQATLRDDSKITNNVANASWSTFDQSNNSSFISNPFATEDLWQPSFNNVINNNLNNSNNNNFQNNDVFSINPANPFRQAQVSIFNNDFNWFGTESQNLENSSSSHLSPFSNKSWQSSVSAFKANPFAVGSGLGDISRNSNNPFL